MKIKKNVLRPFILKEKCSICKLNQANLFYHTIPYCRDCFKSIKKSLKREQKVKQKIPPKPKKQISHPEKILKFKIKQSPLYKKLEPIFKKDLDDEIKKIKDRQSFEYFKDFLELKNIERGLIKKYGQSTFRKS